MQRFAMQRSALPRWQNALLAILATSAVSPLLISIPTDAQQTPLRGKETASHLQPFSFAKQEAIRSAASEEDLFTEEYEVDEHRSAIAETEYNTVNYFNRLENPGNFLTQLSNFSSVNEEDVQVDGGDGGDGTPFDGDWGDGATFGGSGGDYATFGGSGGGSSSTRNDALFAQYLQSEEYNKLWQYDSSKELLPSTLFVDDNDDQDLKPAAKMANGSDVAASDGASDGDLKPAAKKLVHQA
jgi:hypothetical protein